MTRFCAIFLSICLPLPALAFGPPREEGPPPRDPNVPIFQTDGNLGLGYGLDPDGIAVQEQRYFLNEPLSVTNPTRIPDGLSLEEFAIETRGFDALYEPARDETGLTIRQGARVEADEWDQTFHVALPQPADGVEISITYGDGGRLDYVYYVPDFAFYGEDGVLLATRDSLSLFSQTAEVELDVLPRPTNPGGTSSSLADASVDDTSSCGLGICAYDDNLAFLDAQIAYIIFGNVSNPSRFPAIYDPLADIGADPFDWLANGGAFTSFSQVSFDLINITDEARAVIRPVADAPIAPIPVPASGLLIVMAFGVLALVRRLRWRDPSAA